MMNQREATTAMGCGFFTFIGIVALVGWAISGLFSGFDVAKEPPPKPTNPVLVDATFYITGADGGPYEVEWSVIKPGGDYLYERRRVGIIKDKPTSYPVTLDGLDRHADHFLVPTISITARKAEPWQGTLQVFSQSMVRSLIATQHLSLDPGDGT